MKEPMRTLRECLWWMSSHNFVIEMFPWTIPVHLGVNDQLHKYQEHRFRIRGPIGLEYNFASYDILDIDDHFIKACNEIRNQIESPSSQTPIVRRPRPILFHERPDKPGETK